MKQRSRVKLTCVVDLGRGHGQDSAAVFWYLDGKALDWLGQTGPGRGVQVINGLTSLLTYCLQKWFYTKIYLGKINRKVYINYTF